MICPSQKPMCAMKPYPKSLLIKARIWRWIFPLRWMFSTQLWIVSRLALGISWVGWGISVAIDYMRLLYLDYTARPDDVFVITYPRSGTTWLQMIMYQLTTDGNMDFDHIADVCPWFERAALNKRDFDKLPSPRVFKSHLPHIWIPKRMCRYIYVARDGRDVAVSFYHFYKSHFRYKGSFHDFFGWYIRGFVVWGSWFYHVAGYWRHRDDPNLLFLMYEDLVRDLEGSIRKIIDFCGLKIPEERMPEILDRCSFAFMKKHEAKFDFATELMVERGMTPSTFIRKGKVGDWQEHFSDEERARFEEKFNRSMAPLGIRFGKEPEPAPVPAEQ
jgi:Sulfotransferase domain